MNHCEDASVMEPLQGRDSYWGARARLPRPANESQSGDSRWDSKARDECIEKLKNEETPIPRLPKPGVGKGVGEGEAKPRVGKQGAKPGVGKGTFKGEAKPGVGKGEGKPIVGKGEAGGNLLLVLAEPVVDDGKKRDMTYDEKKQLFEKPPGLQEEIYYSYSEATTGKLRQSRVAKSLEVGHTFDGPEPRCSACSWDFPDDAKAGEFET